MLLTKYLCVKTRESLEKKLTIRLYNIIVVKFYRVFVNRALYHERNNMSFCYIFVVNQFKVY
jgi:hypothetical protein